MACGIDDEHSVSEVIRNICTVDDRVHGNFQRRAIIRQIYLRNFLVERKTRRITINHNNSGVEEVSFRHINQIGCRIDCDKKSSVLKTHGKDLRLSSNHVRTKEHDGENGEHDPDSVLTGMHGYSFRYK